MHETHTHTPSPTYRHPHVPREAKGNEGQSVVRAPVLLVQEQEWDLGMEEGWDLELEEAREDREHGTELELEDRTEAVEWGLEAAEAAHLARCLLHVNLWL